MKKTLVLALTTCLATTPVAAYAQSTGAPTSDQPTAPSAGTAADPQATPADQAQDSSSDIVVTAQRREQRLQDVPIAVSVTSGDSLQKQNLVTLESVATRMPAIRVTRNTNSDTITIRGVGSGQQAGFEQAVGTFVDGAYRGRSRSSRSALFDAERVEVLKGPQTTFFGNNTVAGAINITTRKPSQEFGADIRGLYTIETGEYSMDVGITGPITPTLSFRVAGQASGMDGYVYNRYVDDKGPHNRDLAGRVSLRWEPISSFRSDLRIDRVHARDINTDIADLTNCPAPAAFGATAGACALYLAQRGASADTKLDRRVDTLGLFFKYDMLEVEWTNRIDLGKDTLTLTSSYFKHDVRATSNSQPLALTTSFPGVVARGIFQNIEHDENYTQEIRLESPAGKLIQYTVGAYYLRDALRTNGFVGFYASPFGLTFAPAFYTAADKIALNRQLRQITDTKSAFAALTVTPIKGLRFNLGARYTSVRKVGHRYALLGTAGAIPGFDNWVAAPAGAQPLLQAGLGINGTDFTKPIGDYSKFMPSGSVQYDITPTVTAYASYSKGFKAGGYAESNVPNTFDSETADAYEVGIKGSVANGAVFFTLDAFTSDFKNLQVAYTFVSPAGVSSSLIANAAGSRSRGIEGSLNLRASQMLSFKADVAYIDARYTDYKNGPCSEILLAAKPTNCVQDQSGLTRPFAPQWSGSVSASLNLPIGDNQLKFEPLVYFASKYNVSETLDPLLLQKGYAKVDMRIAFGPASGKWELAVIGKNLTDQYTFSNARPLATSRGSYYVFPDPPRTFALAASVKF